MRDVRRLSGWIAIGWLACAAPSAPPDPALPFLHEGEAALAEGDAEQAIAAYQLALAVQPRDPRALRGLLEARVARGAGEGEAALEALAALEEATADPVDPCPALSLAVWDRLGRGAVEPAEEAARRSLAEGCSQARSGLADVLAARARADAAGGDPEGAVASYREAIELDPRDPTRFTAGAELLLELGRARDAVALLAIGLERHPEARALRDLMVHALAIR